MGDIFSIWDFLLNNLVGWARWVRWARWAIFSVPSEELRFVALLFCGWKTCSVFGEKQSHKKTKNLTKSKKKVRLDSGSPQYNLFLFNHLSSWKAQRRRISWVLVKHFRIKSNEIKRLVFYYKNCVLNAVSIVSNVQFMQDLVDAGSKGLKLIARAAFQNIWIVSFLSAAVSLAFVFGHVCIWRSLENELRSQSIDLINEMNSQLRKLYRFCSSCP